MAHLKGMLQAEREKKVVEATEILQLREEVAKLSEGSVKQSQMVKEICDTAHVLLKLLPQTTLMSSSQFVQNPLEQDSFSLSHEAGRTMTVAVEPSLASHGAVQSTENKDVLLLHFPEVSPIAVMDELILDNSNQMNSHPGMLNYMEQHDVQTESIKDESIDLITSIANLPVQERQTGFHETEISTAYVDVDKHGVVMDGSITSFDGTNAVIGNQVSPEDRGPHQDDIPRIDPSFPSHPDGLKADDLKPFSDAPITGAPIRLFKFVARYVSGADLVKQ
ncbi:hypothetical protein KP509_35G026000 [Ceratopteris richardii]|nr:hypothetical protein KP509_35G026000 [Ceratopteris richardii]